MTKRLDSFRIGKRQVGTGAPVFVIAEISANHNQDLETARSLIRAAHDAGADAVKLQTYTADTLTIRSDKPYFRISSGTIWDGQTLHDLYDRAYTPWEWQPELKALAEDLGMECFSTAFDESAVDFLEGLRIPAHKVASFEIVDIPLIRKMAATGKPVVISTGMATFEEIRDAVEAAEEAGAAGIGLFKCTSAYPAPLDEMNLRTIPHLAQEFGVPVGLSDHSAGIAAAVVAVALGATMIEKHLTLSRNVPGPDSAFSLEPGEFASMVQAVRAAERSMGTVHYGPAPNEVKSLPFRRSLFAVRDIRAGEPFTRENVRSIRPSHGLPPKLLDEILGNRAAVDIEAGTPLSRDLVQP